MTRSRMICLLLALTLALSLSIPVLAQEVDCDATYCFTPADFSQEEKLRGICVTQLPDPATGTVLLGSRVIRTGDILTAEQLTQMTFRPLRREADATAAMTYLPIYENRVAASATMTLAIRGKADKAPVAQDLAVETYKNLPGQGKLQVSDPEGEALTYTLVRQPRRGQVELNTDGTFTYNPKKNKVGVDSFTYTAADPAGNVSREATVTVQILKPTDARQYTDTVGQDCRFAAEWMRNTGLFVGEKVGGAECFYPEKPVSRGEFLAMVVKVLEIPMDSATAGVPEETPQWLKPYLAAAMRAGLTAGLPEFEADQPITGGEAAVMLQNALDLTVTREAMETAAAMEAAAKEESQELPVWAAASLLTLADHGITLSADQPLTRGEAAQVLYRVSYLSVTAPGMTVLRMQ